jgi:hypothetical protein
MTSGRSGLRLLRPDDGRFNHGAEVCDGKRGSTKTAIKAKRR